MNGLKIDLISSIFRHTLTLVGGALVASGYISSENYALASGVVVGLIGLGSAAIHHTLANGAAVTLPIAIDVPPAPAPAP